MFCWDWLQSVIRPLPIPDSVEPATARPLHTSSLLTLDLDELNESTNDFSDPMTPEADLAASIESARFSRSTSQPHIFKSSHLPELNRKDLLHCSEHNPHVGYFLLHGQRSLWTQQSSVLSRRVTPRSILKVTPMNRLPRQSIQFSEKVTVSSPVGSSWGGDSWQPPT